MSDVVGSAAFELRATREKMMKDVRDAERDLKQSVGRIESDYAKGGRESAAAFGRGQRQMVRDAERAERDIGRSTEGISQGIRRMAGTLAAAFSVREVTRMADSWTDMTGRMRLAVDAGSDVEGAMSRLSEMAIRTYSSLENTSEGFFRNAGTMRELGYSTNQTLDYIEALNNALVVSGAKGQRAESVMNALSKAMAGGKLDGENLNTVIESGGRVAQLIAERLGVTTLALRDLGREGKITSAVLNDALAGSLPRLRQEAGSMAATVGDAFQNLRTKLTQYVGQADQSLGATDRMAKAIEGLADNLDTVVLLVGALATVMGTKYVLALTASTGALLANGVATARLAAFQTAMTASLTGSTSATVIATGAMARFNVMLAANPIGAAVVAVAALSAGIVFLGKQLEITGNATKDVTAANTALKKATDAYSEAARAAAVATGEESKAAAENAREKRAQAIATRDAAQAKLADAAATVAQIQAEAQRQLDLERRAPIRGDRPGSVRTIGRAERQRLADAEAGAAASAAAIATANAAIAEADAALRRRPDAGTTAVSPRGGPAGSGGAEQMARAREALALEEDIARARSTGDEAAVRAAEERQRLVQLTAQYASAGYADANARAIEHLALLNAAEKLVEDREAAEKEVDRILAGRTRQLEREAEYAELIASQIRDRLGYEVELARLGGSRGEIKAAERRLFIEERTNQILRLRLAMTRAEAEAMAGREWGQLRSSERIGGMRDEFRHAFTDGIKAAIDGDVGSVFESLADRFTDRMLDNLADDLFNLLSEAAKGLIQPREGGGWLSAALRSVGGALGFSRGGPVRGPGTSTSDSIPSLLSAGEFVINAAATSRNRGLLEAINAGWNVPGYALGGVAASEEAGETMVVGDANAGVVR
jgi:tape measure domain-containing protein